MVYEKHIYVLVLLMVVLKDVIHEIKEYNVVKSWLRDLSRNSKINYLEALAEFCKINNVNPEEMLKIIHKEEEERLPAWERSINKWFETFDEHCKDLNRAKSTRDIRRTIVNAFIGFNGLPQYSQRGGRRRIDGLKESNVRPNLTKEEIQLLLDVCKSFKFKAILLTQVSSGLSIADVVTLRIKDFKEGIRNVDNTRICRLTLARNKTIVKFTTFLSDEAITAVEKYLEFERINPQPEEPLFSSYKAGGKQMTTNAIQESYRILNRFAGWKSEKGKYRRATSHMMRKFFNTQLINAGMPEEIREHMMGHTLKDKVREAYFLADPDELEKVYLKYMEHVTIRNFEPPVSVDELQKLQEQINDVKAMLESVNAEEK